MYIVFSCITIPFMKGVSKIEKKFKCEYWTVFDEQIGTDEATFTAEDFESAFHYANNKYGDLISLKQIELFYGEE